MDLDHILNWKLLPGSHDFPGPDGGTCINEVAIVAAGMRYKKVQYVKDLPRCFSPLLGAIAMQCNDTWDDETRGLLLPLVLRLAGSYHGRELETERFHQLAERVEHSSRMRAEALQRAVDGWKINRPEAATYLGAMLVADSCQGLEHKQRLVNLLVELADQGRKEPVLKVEVAVGRLERARQPA